MESVLNQNTSSCILCKVITIHDEGDYDNQPNESEDDDVNFLFKILLKIPPKPGISLVVDGNLINADHLLLLKSSSVQWCDQCSIAIQQARKLYQQIKETTEKFRRIQRKIVETLEKCVIDDNSELDKDENYKAIWRKLCLHNEARFNKFEYPFIVQDLESLLLVPVPVPVVTEEKNDTHEPTTQPSSCQNEDTQIEKELALKTEDVKDEEDDNLGEFEIPNSQEQRILLIFPENDGDHSDQDSGDSLSSNYSDNGDQEDDRLAEDFKEEPQASLTTHHKRCHSSSKKSKPVKSRAPTDFQCPDPQCQKYFNNFANIRQHIKRSHPQIPVPTQQRFSTFHKTHPELYSKIVRNPQTNLFPCPYSKTTGDDPRCPKVFKKKAAVEIHIRVKHLGEPGIYPCTWGNNCTRTFSVWNNYQSHMDRHKGAPRRKCDQCGKQFYSRNSFVRHQQVEHEDGRNRKHFSCEICGKSFSCRDYLYIHKSTSCKVGGTPKKEKGRRKKVIKDKASLKSKAPLNKCKGGNCDICGKVVLNLKQHLESVHTTVRKHMCHLCPKFFNTRSNLKLHLKRHEDTPGGAGSMGEGVAVPKMQKCSVKGCRFKYVRNEQLENHMKRRHGGEDGEKGVEFKCQYCGKGFYLKKYLKHHEETHENEGKDPYGCKVCGKGFRTMSYLKYHQKFTHKMKLEDERKVANR